MTALPIKLLLAVDKDLDREHIEHLLTQEGGVELVGVVDDLDSVWAALDATNAELLVVASPSSSDRALFFIDQAVRQNPERPVVVMAETSTDGYLRRVFEAGADDVDHAFAEPEEIAFSLQKVIARRKGVATARQGDGAADLRPRAEGRHRQDAHRDATSRSRSRSATRTSCSSTSTCSSATSASPSGSRPSGRCTT